MAVFKVLFCGQAKMVKELGASKVIIELADEMANLGWECKLLAPDDLLSIDTTTADSSSGYTDRLHNYLKVNGEKFDVVDYDHEYLPFNRSDFLPTTLMVARSVLLVQHLEMIEIPHGRNFKSRIGHLLKSGKRRQEQLRRVKDADITVANADLVNVSNYDDKAELVRRGITDEKIAVIPYGISRTRAPKFDAISSAIPDSQPTVAFVGTFDYRKGANEFADIVGSVVSRVPNAKFTLLGCQGMMRTEADVLSFFPSNLHKSLDIKMRFASDDLPSLLGNCWAGMFPTYMEGMPFGILEMSAASLPVISYDSPGPSMMLADSSLVRRSDHKAMADKLVQLLTNREKLASARVDAKSRVQKFTWQNAAIETDKLYRDLLEAKRASASDRIGNAS